ncbi:hypothetical protein [Paraburkholderia sp. BCC1876]|uniref:hypothetical protein n=1 Tax=Paraburkholderia sp. BCC1876 TaxID=2676303 RepID=UPI0015901F87|nr:hypothetical protein [Paraburkholderia sp. BCC1876]
MLVAPPSLSTGLWSTAVTVTLRVAMLLTKVPSLNENETVRVVVERLGEVRELENVTDSSAACHCAMVAVPEPVLSVSVPVDVS